MPRELLLSAVSPGCSAFDQRASVEDDDLVPERALEGDCHDVADGRSTPGRSSGPSTFWTGVPSRPAVDRRGEAVAFGGAEDRSIPRSCAPRGVPPAAVWPAASLAPTGVSRGRLPGNRLHRCAVRIRRSTAEQASHDVLHPGRKRGKTRLEVLPDRRLRHDGGKSGKHRSGSEASRSFSQ